MTCYLLSGTLNTTNIPHDKKTVCTPTVLTPSLPQLAAHIKDAVKTVLGAGAPYLRV